MERILHPAQYDVFTDQILDIDRPHYNIGLYIKLQGNLNREMFAEAVRSSPGIFDVFKMRFDANDLKGVYYLENSYVELEMPELDFSIHDDPKNVALSWMQERFRTPFLLQKERVSFEQYLLKIDDAEHWFYCRFHHLITDAYGFVIWVNYISRKYSSLLNNENRQFINPSYIGAARIASASRDSAAYEITASYWKEKIKSVPESALRKNISFSNKQLKTSGNYYLNISKEQRTVLDEVIRVTKSNLHQLTIAALLIYFGKTSGQSEIIFGVPVHKRGKGELRNILGMFSGVLPFKGVYNDDIKLNDLLSGIASSRKADNTHQDFLIGDLIRSLKINVSESNLYDVVINYVPFNFGLDFGGEIQSKVSWLNNEYEKLPLHICWRDYGNQQPLELGLHYSYEYFTREEIALLAERIIFIIAQFTDSLFKDIGSICIIPPSEKRLLDSFNNTFAAYPADKTLIDLFEEQVLKSPDAIAVIFEDKEYTFHELNSRSNQLSHYLRKRGVKEDVLVPICIERSLEMVVAILGILKAGGAYVPIDPDYPVERTRFILEDTGASLIISSKLTGSKLVDIAAESKIELDTGWPVISKEPANNIKTGLKPHNLAYVIYTSGSTGKPKGVLIEHKGVVNFCKAIVVALKLKPGIKTLQFASIGFDVSVEEIFGALLSGGSVVIPKKEDILSVEGFGEFVDKHKIERATLPPSYLSLMKDRLGTIKTLVSAGESLNAAIGKYIQSKGIWLINGYGPTENTVSVCISDNPINDNDRNIIGKPLSNIQAYIMDKQRTVLPIGCIGEICVAGVQVARGYLNRPDLTAEKFIANPFSEDLAARIYCTGDLGRWLPDGTLEYFGRIDNQVKIRGFRIELEEIESVLQQSDLVRQAVVLISRDNEGNSRLVCYIVKGNNFEQARLNEYLVNKLPDYMIPALWVQLDKFPLTSNGKIDKNALPGLKANPISAKHVTAPRNAMERKLAAIWKNLLNVDEVSVFDNFFKQGGNSLLAIRLIAQIKDETGKRLSISYFLKNPTLDKLAQLLSEEKVNNKERLLIPVNSPGRNKKVPFYIVCGAGGTALPFYEFSRLLDVEQPVFVLQQPTASTDTKAFPDTIESIATKYIDEILIENPDGPYALSGHCIGGIIAFEMARQFDAMGKEVKLLAMFDTVTPVEQKSLPATVTNFFQIPAKIQRIVSTVYLKIDFETFLLRKHSKHAIRYKINGLKSLVNKFYNKNAIDKDLEDFRKLEQKYQAAYSNYVMTPYKGEIVVFFAKDHYKFADKNNNIWYRRTDLDDTTKSTWKQYGKSVKVYEVEGEHSTIFHPDNAVKFVQLLQQHLNEISVN